MILMSCISGGTERAVGEEEGEEFTQVSRVYLCKLFTVAVQMGASLAAFCIIDQPCFLHHHKAQDPERALANYALWDICRKDSEIEMKVEAFFGRLARRFFSASQTNTTLHCQTYRFPFLYFFSQDMELCACKIKRQLHYCYQTFGNKEIKHYSEGLVRYWMIQS